MTTMVASPEEQKSRISAEDRLEFEVLMRSLLCIPPEENELLGRIVSENVAAPPDEFEGLFADLSG